MEVIFTKDDFMPSESKCAKFLKNNRWKNGLKCIYCDSLNVKFHGKWYEHYDLYLCNHCGKSFNDKTGTIFQDSKIPLREWVTIAKYLHLNVSILKISQELGRKYDHVHRAAKKIMKSVFEKRFLEQLSGVVEIDEMYISSGEKGSRTLKREPRKRGLKLRGRGTYDKDKPPMAGAVERGGKISLQVLPNMRKRSVNKVLKRVKKKSKVYTDDFKAYNSLKKKGYTHKTVNHSEKEYARGDVHTNTIEGAFQGLRHFLDTFKGVCKRNLSLYVALYEFLYNERTSVHEKRMNTFIKTGLLIGIN